MKKVLFLAAFTLACLPFTASAQLSDGTKGLLKLDVQVQDELGIDTVSQVVELKHIQASEIEPFIQARLSRWGAVQVNDALNMVVITDKKAKLADLTALVRQMDTPRLKEFLRLETVSIPLSYTNPELVRSLVSAQLSKEGRLIVDNAHNALVITDLRSKIDSIQRIVAKLDVFSPQVEIEAAVVEVSGDTLRKAGLDIEALRDVQGTASGSIDSAHGRSMSTDYHYTYNNSGTLITEYKDIHTSENGSTYPPWTVSGSIDINRFFNVVNLWVTQNKARILTRTTIVTSNNSTGTFTAGDRVVYPSKSSGGSHENSLTGGLSVSVRPLIGKDAVVQLSIQANLDNLNGWSPEGAPIFENRSTQSTITLKDGQTFLLSGLHQTVTVDSEKGIPVLKSILPFIFSKKTKTKVDKEILVLLTPRIQRAPTAAPEDAMKKLEEVSK